MEFYGLIGEKLGHSLSPVIHKRVFELLGIEGAYKLFPIPKEDIKYYGKSLKVLGIKGVNVTIPYKQEVMKELDFISDEASKIGAVNTILLKDNKLYGYNSDYFGFGMLLDNNNIEVKDNVVVVMGNGGAAKALLQYILDNNPKKLYLVTRNKDSVKKSDIKEGIDLIDYEELKNVKGDVLVNSTPVGMYPNVSKSVVSEDIIKNFDSLVDIVYNPKCTEFMKIGQQLGKRVCNGLYMLVGQAIKSQEIWQDKKIEKEIIDKIYEEIEKEF